MGVRAAIVVCVTSFLLGALFTHWIADSLTLWKSPVTDEHLWTAVSYYSILAKWPPAIFWTLGSIVALGGSTLLWSLNDFRAGNIMFDGGSIYSLTIFSSFLLCITVLFGTTIVMYTATVFPNIISIFGALPAHAVKDPIPRALRNATLDLASNNLICSVALTGVLALQAGRYWAESADSDDEEDGFVVVEQPQAATTSGVEETTTAAFSPPAATARKAAANTPEISISNKKVKPLLQQRVQAS